MDRDTIIRKTNEALASEFELDETAFGNDVLLKDDLGLDSLDYVDMVVVLEHAFHFTIPDRHRLASIRTMGDIYDFIESTALARDQQDNGATPSEPTA